MTDREVRAALGTAAEDVTFGALDGARVRGQAERRRRTRRAAVSAAASVLLVAGGTAVATGLPQRRIGYLGRMPDRIDWPVRGDLARDRQFVETAIETWRDIGPDIWDDAPGPYRDVRAVWAGSYPGGRGAFLQGVDRRGRRWLAVVVDELDRQGGIGYGLSAHRRIAEPDAIGQVSYVSSVHFGGRSYRPVVVVAEPGTSRIVLRDGAAVQELPVVDGVAVAELAAGIPMFGATVEVYRGDRLVHTGPLGTYSDPIPPR